MQLITKILTFGIYFSTGFFIPILSRFLIKFYPCSLHSFLGDIIKHYFNKKQHKTQHYITKYKSLKLQYLLNKIMWGIFYLIIFILLKNLLPINITSSNTLIILFISLFLLGLSANIDNRSKLIPDILTFKMILVNFLFLILCEKNNIFSYLNITPIESILSAIIIYVLTSILALIFYFKNPYSFGGGDVKLITAVTVLTGIKNISYIILITFFISLLTTLIKKDKYFALAPIIFISFLIWLFSLILINI